MDASDPRRTPVSALSYREALLEEAREDSVPGMDSGWCSLDDPLAMVEDACISVPPMNQTPWRMRG